jgi:hypothetical protein
MSSMHLKSLKISMHSPQVFSCCNCNSFDTGSSYARILISQPLTVKGQSHENVGEVRVSLGHNYGPLRVRHFISFFKVLILLNTV